MLYVYLQYNSLHTPLRKGGQPSGNINKNKALKKMHGTNTCMKCENLKTELHL